MNLQAQLAADDAAITTTELRATIRRQAEEIEQLEAIVERLTAERNRYKAKYSNVRMVAQANKETAEYWRGRALAAEMAEHDAQWWEG